MGDQSDFGVSLVDAGYLYPTGVRGVVGRSSTYANIANGLNALVDDWAAELTATGIQFPPIVNRATFEETNYVQSFPDLMGAIHVFTGGNKEHAELLRRSESGQGWSDL